MSVIQDIALGINNNKGNINEATGKEIEELLTNISRDLSRIAYLTEEKADIEFLLMIVGSYLIAKEQGTLEEGAKSPAELFEENLIPNILNYTPIEAEVIEDAE